jgi:SAM-dependent methyltransferase
MRHHGEVTEPRFRADLFRGTAEWYDAYRPPYPRELIDDLAARIGADGSGRMLDVACGTGQVAFALRESFAEIWAIDQEPEMIAVAARKAAGHGGFIFRIGAAEELDLPPGAFDLITIGNAFHRLPRDLVAHNVRRWLRPGGYLALLWGGSPNLGGAPWQQTLEVVMRRWMYRNGVEERLPAGYDAARRARPNLELLAADGFELVASFHATVGHAWTIDEIAGNMASTSVLSRAALGDEADNFDADLREALRYCQQDGALWQDMTFTCELVRVPLPGSTG